MVGARLARAPAHSEELSGLRSHSSNYFLGNLAVKEPTRMGGDRSREDAHPGQHFLESNLKNENGADERT